nr:ankyrin repeat-containing protein bda1 [Quercus suber]
MEGHTRGWHIFISGPIPDGANAVIQVEETEQIENAWVPTINSFLKLWQYLLRFYVLVRICNFLLYDFLALAGQLDFSKALLLQKPQLAVELDSHKRCPLHLASAEGHVDIVRALLHANSNACLIRDQDGRIPLHYAVIRGGVEVVKEFIITRPDSTQVMLDGGETVLHLRVKHNQLEALKLLVESVSDKGDFLNSKDHDGGNTILQLAVMLKQVETIKYLLLVPKVKEAVDFLNNTGFTALEMLEHCPKDFKSFTIRNILMYAGVSIKRVNNPSPPLAIAVGHSESVQEQSSKKGRRNWFGYLKYEGDWVEDNHGSIMVVSTVITTITFQQTISPPGGLWQENVIDTMQGFRCSLNTPCLAGKAVLADAFDYWNYLPKIQRTMERSRSRSLEDENELVRSTKKVKDSHNETNNESPIRRGGSSFSNKLSFRDKLVGEIQGAYSQTLAFSDQMEASSESDEETEDVREGFAAISLSKETK